MSEFRRKYTLSDRFGSDLHSWSLIGCKGAVELNVTVMKDGNISGGIEVHSRTPTHTQCAPSHDECHLLHQPCWHDGSSLYVEERIKPYWEFPASKGHYEEMFSHLVRAYRNHFTEEEE